MGRGLASDVLRLSMRTLRVNFVDPFVAGLCSELQPHSQFAALAPSVAYSRIESIGQIRTEKRGKSAATQRRGWQARISLHSASRGAHRGGANANAQQRTVRFMEFHGSQQKREEILKCAAQILSGMQAAHYVMFEMTQTRFEIMANDAVLQANILIELVDKHIRKGAHAASSTRTIHIPETEITEHGAFFDPRLPAKKNLAAT
jgi:hypothetical protein